jgi:sodium/potassium-transporting ATPase subunit alpha
MYIYNVVEGDSDALVVRGTDIPKFTEEIWNWVLSHNQLIFARTSPEQKLRIVKEYQRLG